ncbi:MAG: hypothetical protein ACYTF1_01625 [Planctomycetota bacterium]|jgi:hypothetical protein
MDVLGNIDLFHMFRWMLATVCTVYVIVCTFKSIVAWLKYFQSSRETAVMGRYATLLLIRLRFRRFFWDLCQILILTAILAWVLYAHYKWGI